MDTDDDRDDLDRAAEAWLRKRHGRGWYVGNATSREWQDAYAHAIAAEDAGA